MKIIKLLLFYVLFIFSSSFSIGQSVVTKDNSVLSKNVSQWVSNAEGLHFRENKGQMMDMQHKPVNNVLYKTGAGGMDIYVTNNGLTYVFVQFEKHKKGNSTSRSFKYNQQDSVIIKYCRADMNLVGADIRKENIVQENESEDRTDYYYGGVCPNGILNVHSYGKITVKNIYPGIDWVLHGGKHGLKYDFVVHPGANPSLIGLSYKWTDKPQLQPDGTVKINTPMGNITEGIPVSYVNTERSNASATLSNQNTQVQTIYSVENNEIHFKISKYNSTHTLIIDPVLVWGTYYGGGDVELDDVTSMQEDGKSVWVTGQTSSVNFPMLNPGAGAYFQGTFPGNATGFILQFNTAGVLKWATYYGGTGGDTPLSIYSDKSNVWVTGVTESKDFPLLNPLGGAYFQPKKGGNLTVFILQFDVTGVRKWATYYGGNTEEYGNSIQSDGTHVWLTGETFSRNLPTLNPGGGAYFQPAIGGGANAYIAEFNITGVMTWATYYGGNSIQFQEAGNSIYSDGTDVWVTGFSTSTNFPMLNPGGGAYFQGTLPGTSNPFILKFTVAGVRKWATYYGGSNTDGANSIYSDGSDVWITGGTGSTDFPTLNPGGGAYFQGAVGGASNAFILQFDTAAVSKWATYYGGSNKDIGYSIQNDGINVWVCGSTSSADFPTLSTNCGFYQDTLGSNPRADDAFILQFSKTGIPQWATYYGTDLENDGSYTWCDGRNLFIAGDDEIRGYPTKNPGGGAYFDDTVTGGIENIFIGKLVLSEGGGNLTVGSGDSICNGDTTTLSSGGVNSYQWSPPAGLSSTNIPNPVANPTVTTTYTITGIDTGLCGKTFIDSIRIVVENNNPNDILISKDTSICAGASIILNASGGTRYKWNNGATTSSITITDDKTSDIYTVNIDNKACKKDTDLKVSITVVPPPKTDVSGNKVICKGNNIQLDVSGGSTYLWSNGDTTTTYLTGAIESDSTITITAYNSIGCPHDTTVTIIPDIPSLTACCNTILTTENDTTLVAYGSSTQPYHWSPQVACINPPLCDSVKVSPTVTTTYTVTMTDSLGCQVERLITIIVDVPCFNFTIPNVFTPDYPGPLGTDNTFHIQTKYISAWDIIIYDRWGKEMFHTSNPTQYWDGNTESGGKAPDGVYYYIIDATCQSTSYKKDGFLQLIR